MFCKPFDCFEERCHALSSSHVRGLPGLCMCTCRSSCSVRDTWRRSDFLATHDSRRCRFSDNALTHVARMQQLLQKQSSSPVALYSVHGHYSDAGEAAALISHTLGVPMVLTGHSLGRNKLDHLLRCALRTRIRFHVWEFAVYGGL